jgi:polysaccharide biosynthesis/export protein
MEKAQDAIPTGAGHRRGARFGAVLGAVLLAITTGSADAAGAEYPVANGDVLRVTVYGDAGLSGSFPVGADGTIGYPLLGNLVVTGKSIEDIRKVIDDGLKVHIANLSVAVVVETYAPVYIVGEVQRPGKYEFRPGMIALELFALGGGQKEQLSENESGVSRLANLRLDYADLGVQLLAQDVKRTRLQAELDGQPFSYRASEEIGTPDVRIVQQVVAAERTLFELRRASLEAELKSLEQQKIGYVEEIDTLEKSGKLRDGELALLSEDVRVASAMVERGLTSKTQLREKQREISATNRDVLEFGSFLARARQNLTVIDSQLISLRGQRRSEAAAELREVNIDILRLRRKMAYNIQAMAEAGIALQKKDGSRQIAFRFSAIRMLDGTYQEVEVGQTDPVRAGDILRVSIVLDEATVARR